MSYRKLEQQIKPATAYHLPEEWMKDMCKYMDSTLVYSWFSACRFYKDRQVLQVPSYFYLDWFKTNFKEYLGKVIGWNITMTVDGSKYIKLWEPKNGSKKTTDQPNTNSNKNAYK